MKNSIMIILIMVLSSCITKTVYIRDLPDLRCESQTDHKITADLTEMTDLELSIYLREMLLIRNNERLFWKKQYFCVLKKIDLLNKKEEK